MGETVPDVSPATEFRAFSLNPVVSDAGDAAFRVFLAEVGAPAVTSEGLFLNTGGGHQVIALGLDVAPGTGGALFQGFPFGFDINGDSDVVFQANLLSGEGVFVRELPEPVLGLSILTSVLMLVSLPRQRRERGS